MSLLDVPNETQISIGTIGDFDQMVTELGFDRAEYFADLSRENHIVKFLDHLTRGELTQSPTLLAGRALGVRFGNFSEVFTAFDHAFESVAVLFVGHQAQACQAVLQAGELGSGDLGDLGSG